MKIEWDFSELSKFADNLSNLNKFEREMKFATKEIASALLTTLKEFTPVGDTYQLVNGWNGNDLAVKQVEGGFEVLIVNADEKALWVNDGHKAYNQFGGPYPIRNRVKVTSPHQWQKGDSTYYVFGHFFVERSILEIGNTNQIEEIIMKKLQKWWDSV